MRFDLSGCGAGLDESTGGILKLAPWAESLGYDGVWINEERFGQGRRVCLSPILLATALAIKEPRGNGGSRGWQTVPSNSVGPAGRVRPSPCAPRSA